MLNLAIAMSKLLAFNVALSFGPQVPTVGPCQLTGPTCTVRYLTWLCTFTSASLKSKNTLRSYHLSPNVHLRTTMTKKQAFAVIERQKPMDFVTGWRAPYSPPALNLATPWTMSIQSLCKTNSGFSHLDRLVELNLYLAK
jgi:hypothetical protein